MYPVNVRHASGGAKSFAAATTMPHVVGERGQVEPSAEGAEAEEGGHSDMVRIIRKRGCLFLAGVARGLLGATNPQFPAFIDASSAPLHMKGGAKGGCSELPFPKGAGLKKNFFFSPPRENMQLFENTPFRKSDQK